jgi:FKBP-type peptidyl-prolyl cis-trans isomerase
MKSFILSIFAASTVATAVYAADPVPPSKASPPQSPTKFAPPPEQPKTDFSKFFKSETEKFNYAVGMSWASQIKARTKGREFPMDTDAMTRGFRDMLNDTNIITEAQMKEALTSLDMYLRTKMEEKRKMAAEKNKTEGETFLAKNKTESGVTTTASGLQYKVITEGAGDMPKLNDMVTVNYKGTLLDGTEFDSSAKAGKPFTTSLHAGPGGVIQGWVEALQLMKPGAKWKLFIPPALAYAEHGSGAAIGPDATLQFEVELISTQPASAVPPPPAVPNNGAPLTSDIIKVPSAEGLKKGEKIETIKADDLEKERAKEAAKNGGGSTAPK